MQFGKVDCVIDLRAATASKKTTTRATDEREITQTTRKQSTIIEIEVEGAARHIEIIRTENNV